MILVISRKCVALGAVFCITCFSLVFFKGMDSQSVFSPQRKTAAIVIVDAGHGGEDGGAVSSDGVAESQLNLAVALRLDEVLRLMGQQTKLTRREDVSIGESSLSTVKARKASDLKKRVAMVNETPGAILLSVHQNSLPSSPVTHGAQVFWNTQPGAEVLATSIQEVLNTTVNLEKGKKARPIPSSIYLTKHAQAPGVVVECGFLSNKEETQRLQQPDYQTKLAVSIAAGYLNSREAS